MSDPKPRAAELVEVFLRMGKAGHYTTALLEDIVFAARAEAVAPVVEVLRELVAAMPTCEWDEYECKEVATRHAYKQQFFCAVHQFASDVQPVEWAAPLRAALALLAEHKEGT